MTQSLLVPRPAATVVLVRDNAGQLETLMMQRTHQASFVAGAYVFPGGAVDATDKTPSMAAYCESLDDAGASHRLGMDEGGLAYWIAAIRECFEEAGLLLAYERNGGLVELRDAAKRDRFSRLRPELASGKLSLADICREHGLRLAADRLACLSHWITPPGLARRFDTRFFVAVAPQAQTASHDEAETIDHVWIRPADALERHRKGEISLVFATIKTLELLTRFEHPDAVMAHARAATSIMPNLPRVAQGRDGRTLLLPADHAYAEVGKLDPTGAGTVSSAIVPGRAVCLSDRVRRITAPNPSVMTGPGTNTYLIGAGDDIAVVDPGPADENHVRVLLEQAQQAGGRIRRIFVTHTHMDHSPAASLLKKLTGADIFGMPSPPTERQDHGFRPDHVPRDGQRFTVGDCTLRAIHTPGHASNHLCYLLEEEQLLFTGDHIMQGSTVVINPPDGDMLAYVSSLRQLEQEPIAWLAPGHGFLMDRPHEVIGALLRHRSAREEKIYDALCQAGAASVEELVPLAYDDVPAHKHRMAGRSLLAHLIKLRADGRVEETDGYWRTIAGPRE